MEKSPRELELEQQVAELQRELRELRLHLPYVLEALEEEARDGN